MSDTKQLSYDNVVLLKQLASFVKDLTSSQFIQSNRQLNSGSIAAHTRHIIEHYQTVIGLGADQEVDYDDRPRNQQLEQCQGAAVNALTSLQAQLLNLVNESDLVTESSPSTISIKCATNTHSARFAVRSSFARELVFLHSHTTHHMAIIRLLALSDAIEVDDSFGKAASTKKHEQELEEQIREADVQSKLA